MTWTRPWMAAVVAILGCLLVAGPAAADTQSFSNTSPVDTGTGPSEIVVSGMFGVTSKLTATVNFQDFSTIFPSQLDVLLVAPDGRGTILMSDAGGDTEQAGAPIVFDDDAAANVGSSIPWPGPTTFKPTDYDPPTINPPSDVDNFAPFSPPAGAADFSHTLADLGGASPNGTWKLYAVDDATTNTFARIFYAPVASGWSLSATTTTPAPPPSSDPPANNQDPQPVPQQPVDPTAPQIQSAEFQKPPVPGQPALLHVVARDPDSPVTGVIVDFGEPLGFFAESACQSGQPMTGGTVEFDVPYTYLTAGAKDVKVTVLSGGCGTAQTAQVVKTFIVGAATASRVRAHASTTLSGPPITTACKDATLLPSKAKTKAIIKALLCVMNEQRKLANARPLKLGSKLAKAAIAHSRAMIAGRFFAHQGPKERALPDRLKKAKYRSSAGENLAAGSAALATPVAIVNGWMHSSLHKVNLLSKRWRTVGVGFLAQFPLASGVQPVATFTADFGLKG